MEFEDLIEFCRAFVESDCGFVVLECCYCCFGCLVKKLVEEVVKFLFEENLVARFLLLYEFG